MPTIWYEQGFRFSFYMADGAEPPHVHVWKGGATAKWWLDPAREAWNAGFGARDRLRIRQIVTRREQQFLAEWRRQFGV